ncbi:MAG: radical SAM protein [Bacteroidales bacterium]|jgi:wyosine [tRNA(Phe)-imidazoG37] synthetase (radical SAM superfamily)|nr:radical SAM protein [Bacteroidales bacterium]
MISFGPVPSRRLGCSLGINNIVSPKSCSYNCIYCQVGKTRQQTSGRGSYFTPETIYKSVVSHLALLSKQDTPDFLTFVSNGEPTLDINLGKSIKMLKSTGIPVAVITNGSLLSEESVAEDLSGADWISVKVDAADNEIWKNINRPSPDIDFDRLQQGIFNFFRHFNGVACTETMLVRGVNDSPGHLFRLSAIIHELNPSKAYLSVPVRPPSVRDTELPSEETLNMSWHTFTEKGIITEMLTGFEGTGAAFTGNIYEDILNITAVHPLREDSMAELLSRDMEGERVLDSLLQQRLIKMVRYRGKKYYLRQYNT